MFIRALKDPYRPVAAHIIPIRRCNLSCTYCNEYDDHSSRSTADMLGRMDRLAELGTSIITLSGGEPLLHPDLDEIIRRMRAARRHRQDDHERLSAEPRPHQRLNAPVSTTCRSASTTSLPDDVSKKSLKVLDKKLQMLAEHAEFHVNINSVVGGGIRNPDDALVVARARASSDFRRPSASSTTAADSCAPRRSRAGDPRRVCAGKVGVQLREVQPVPEDIATASRTTGAAAPAAAICISARTASSTTARSSAAIRATRSSNMAPTDLRREYHVVKSCAPHCTIGCVHRVAQVDELRQNPRPRWRSGSPRSTQRRADRTCRQR